MQMVVTNFGQVDCSRSCSSINGTFTLPANGSCTYQYIVTDEFGDPMITYTISFYGSYYVGATIHLGTTFCEDIIGNDFTYESSDFPGLINCTAISGLSLGRTYEEEDNCSAGSVSVSAL